jgi:homoserine O-acetyltransferase
MFFFQLTEQQFLAQHIQDAQFKSINCAYGHDGFLIETDKLTQYYWQFFERECSNKKVIIKWLRTAIANWDT